MKPLKLTIEGLNSFEQCMVIDFEALMKNGLFGIFGPTGSGKSSIIDGLTLALYGNVARGSKNFINVNTDRCRINLLFQAGNAEDNKRYKVSRSFKKDKQTNNARADKAVLELIDDDTSEVLADMTKSVDEKCSEIIGISKEDFARTVVLPQGKFSEFLQMRGADRTDMLERIFKLERFGEDLNQKIKTYRTTLDKSLDQLEGQKKAYEHVSKERLTEQREDYRLKGEEIKRLEEETKHIKEYIRKWQAVREAEEQKRANKSRLSQLLLQEADMGEQTENLKNAATAMQLSTLRQSKLQSETFYLELRKTKEEAEAAKTRLLEARLKADEEKEASERRLYEEEPKINAELLAVDKAIQKADELAKHEEEAEKMEKKLQTIQKKLGENHTLSEQNQTELSKLEAEIRDIQGELKRLFHPQTYKELVEEGAKTEEDLTRILNQLEAKKERIKAENIVATEMKRSIAEQNEALAHRKQENDKLEILVKELTGELADFPDFTKEELLLRDATLAKQSNSEYEKEVSDAKEQIEATKKAAAEAKIQLEEKKLTLSGLDADIEKLKLRTFAFRLSRDIKEGEPCPVCGSTSHKAAVKHSTAEEEQLKDKEKELLSEREKIEKAIKSLESEIVLAASAEEKAKERQTQSVQKMSELNQTLLSIDTEKREKMLKQQRISKEDTEIKLADAREVLDKEKTDYYKASNVLTQKQTLLKAGTDKLTALQNEAEELEEKLKEVSQKKAALYERLKAEEKVQEVAEPGDKEPVETSEDDKIFHSAFFTERWRSVKEDTAASEKADERLRLVTERQKEQKELADKISREASELEKEDIKDKAEKKAILDKTSRLRKELVETVETWENLPERREGLVQRFKGLTDTAEASKKEQLAMTEKSAAAEKHCQEVQRKEASAEAVYHEKEQAFAAKMTEAGLTDASWIEAHLKSDEAMRDLEIKIKKYNDEVTHIRKLLQELEEKLDGKSIDEEEWTKNTERLENIENRLTVLGKEYAVLGSEIGKLKEELDALSKIQEELSEVTHQKALVSELEKLFRGKAFVQYAATHYLKYVTRDANVRLRQMTHGNYELELSENGDFLMRDYKNGGKVRPCATLSGGETFIVSLALALALSKQIQLKGAASVDLFFLDEGFGTLDENFIEVVMDSLYSLRDRGLNVGLITHVEAIKERIGARALVTPAESGGIGSKIELEFC